SCRLVYCDPYGARLDERLNSLRARGQSSKPLSTRLGTKTSLQRALNLQPKSEPKRSGPSFLTLFTKGEARSAAKHPSGAGTNMARSASALLTGSIQSSS